MGRGTSIPKRLARRSLAAGCKEPEEPAECGTVTVDAQPSSTFGLVDREPSEEELFERGGIRFEDDVGMMGGTAADVDGAVTVEPGKTRSITTMFDETGTVLIGCHEPGHWEAGMKATITVR
jgi:uncharacterized cupredoxin-like copper-binding protein